jgi:hypothetical protein
VCIGCLDTCGWLVHSYTHHGELLGHEYNEKSVFIVIELWGKSPCLWTCCFHPLSPLFQWYLQSKEILLNLRRLVSRVIIVIKGPVKIYVAAVEALRKNRMKLNLPPKLQRKLVWFPVTLFCKIFIPSSAFDALLCWNYGSCPPSHRRTLHG